MSVAELRLVAKRAKRVLKKSGYGGWDLQDAYAKLKEAFCDHNYVDPSNEAVRARGHEICVNCGGVRRVEEDPTPWCHVCGAKEKAQCDCGPIAENH